MSQQTFNINTLHRGKYMLSFFILLFACGMISSQIPGKEMVKIIAMLFMIPVVLFLSVKLSMRPSVWQLTSDRLHVQIAEKEFSFQTDQIDHIKNLTRSGGNLFIIHQKNAPTRRLWRNKLFTKDDDYQALHEALLEHNIEYYKM